MTRKPTSQSVTDEPCRCGYLVRASEEPSIPFVFDDSEAADVDLIDYGPEGIGFSFREKLLGKPLGSKPSGTS